MYVYSKKYLFSYLIESNKMDTVFADLKSEKNNIFLFANISSVFVSVQNNIFCFEKSGA